MPELDSTVAGADANSYIDVDEADAYAEVDTVNGAAWLAATEDQRTAALIAATVDVDFYTKAATRYATTQALLFPREGDIDAAALPFLPADAKRATYEQAVYLLRYAPLIADSAARRARGLYSFSDDDGSGTQALNPVFGLYAPKMTQYLDRLDVVGRAVRQIVSVPMTSSYE